jgi:membrane protein DedA with SNARE-associated domain
VCAFVFIGYHFGENWRAVLALVEANLRLASAIGLGLIVAYAALVFFWRRRKQT